MKGRTLFITLLLVATLVLTACGSEKKRTAALFDDETEKNGYYLDMETTVQSQNMRLKMHVKGDSLYADVNTDGYMVEMIKNKDGYFILQPDLLIGYKINEEMFNDSADMNILESMGPSLEGKDYTAGKANVDGEEYEFEEYKVDGTATKFCYDGEDQLRYIIVESEDELTDPQKIKVHSFKKGADESMFTIPNGYSIQEWNEIDDWYDDTYDDYEDIY